MLGLWSDDGSELQGHIPDAQALGFDALIARCVRKIATFQTDPYFQQLCRDAVSIGVTPMAWYYAYPSRIQEQIEAIARAVTGIQIAGLVLDAEGEWEGANPSIAEDLCHGIAQATGHRFPLHLSSFFDPAVHQTFPFAAFGRHCQSWCPQVYVHGDGEGNDPQRTVSRAVGNSVAHEFLGQAFVPVVDDPALLGLLKAQNVHNASAWLWAREGSDPGVRDDPDSWKAAIEGFGA